MWFEREGIYHGFVYGKENAQVAREILRQEKQHTKTPILLRGTSGSGKTLLLNILRRQMSENGLQVRMVQGNVYIAELIDAIRNEDFACFQLRYRADMILLDDLTCIKDKYASQLELLCHLKHCAQDGIQVIFTAPSEYDEALNILYHFFEGRVVEIQRPSRKTVRRIIAYHAEKKSVTLQKHQIDRIAEKTAGNGFLVEGAIALQHFYQYVAADMVGVSAR